MGSGIFFLAWSVIPLTIALVLTAASIRAIWITLTAPRKGVRQPSCEKCKYPVAGLSTLNCPECGSDLRAVGIITRPMEMRRRGGLFAAILGLTFLVLLGFGIAMTVYVNAIIPSWNPSPTAPTVTTTTLTPASGAYTSLSLDQPFGPASATPSGPLYSAALELTLIDGSKPRFEVTSGRNFRASTDPDAAPTTGTLSRAALAQWFRDSGFDTSNAAIATEIDESIRMLDITLVTPYTPPQAMAVSAFTIRSTTTTGGSPAPYSPAQTRLWTIFGWAIPITLFIIWLVSLILMVRRRRRLIRDAALAP